MWNATRTSLTVIDKLCPLWSHDNGYSTADGTLNDRTSQDLDES